MYCPPLCVSWCRNEKWGTHRGEVADAPRHDERAVVVRMPRVVPVLIVVHQAHLGVLHAAAVAAGHLWGPQLILWQPGVHLGNVLQQLDRLLALAAAHEGGRVSSVASKGLALPRVAADYHNKAI